MNEELSALRERAKEGRDPTAADETLRFLLHWAKEHGVKKYLEIGAAEGLTATALLLETAASVTAIEKDAARAQRARENFARFGAVDRAELFEGDAGEIPPMIGGGYDLIFLDGPKVQYLKYLPDCKRLLNRGGALCSDDILLFGWVRGEAPKKRRMLVEHIREYLRALEEDSELKTTVYEYGEGLAVSIKL